MKKTFTVLEKANAFEEEVAFNEIQVESLHQFIQLKKSWDKLTRFLSKLANKKKIIAMGRYSLMKLKIKGRNQRQ